jgi:hypothetical protein
MGISPVTSFAPANTSPISQRLEARSRIVLFQAGPAGQTYTSLIRAMTACWKHEHLLADSCATFDVLLPFSILLLVNSLSVGNLLLTQLASAMLAISKWLEYRPGDGQACSLQNQLSEFYY